MLKRLAKIKPGNRLINCAEVARRLGLSRRYVCSLLRGEKRNPRRMKQIFDLVIEEFLIANQRCEKAKNRSGSRWLWKEDKGENQ
jgi:hypothetical protein